MSAKVKFVSFEPLLDSMGELDLTGISWAIVGGESGPHFRGVESEWIRDIRKQCRKQKVAFFFKQWGGKTPKVEAAYWMERNGMDFPRVPSRRKIKLKQKINQY